MEIREGLSPIEATSEVLRRISSEYGMEYGMEAGKYRLSKEGVDGLIDVDFDGSIKSFELLDANGEQIMAMGKTDIKTVEENLSGYLLKNTSLEPSEARRPLHEEPKLRQASKPGKIEIDKGADLEKAA